MCCTDFTTGLILARLMVTVYKYMWCEIFWYETVRGTRALVQATQWNLHPLRYSEVIWP